MKTVIRIILVLVAFVFIVGLIGFFIPKDYHVERTVIINAPVEKVFAEVNDLRSWKNWTAWNEADPHMKTTYGAKTIGIGGKMIWKSCESQGGSLVITEFQPNEMLGFDLFFEGYEKSTSYLTFEPQGKATKVIWAMDGSMGSNPFSRYFGLMMDKMIGKDFEKGLAKLNGIC